MNFQMTRGSQFRVQLKLKLKKMKKKIAEEKSGAGGGNLVRLIAIQ